MKKMLAVIMTCALVLSLCACGSSDAAPGTTGAAAATTAGASSHGFMVGYSKVDVTPTAPAPLSGYGNTDERLHTEVLDPLYFTCVAMTDAEDNTAMFITIDLCSIDKNTVSSIRGRINSKTGVPKENIMVSITHTHSAPQASAMSSQLMNAAQEAGEEAMADRKEAKMFISKANTENINFVRHYKLQNGEYVGDNHGMDNGQYVGHATEVDQEMRVIKFTREGGKDVVLANWQSHPHITGGFTRTSMSADIIGMFRMNMEKDGYLFAYYQGGGGNINPTSRIKGESANSSNDYRVSGQMLASTCKMAMKSEVEAETGLIQINKVTFEAEANREELDKMTDAGMVRDYYEQGHTPAETAVYAQENFGIQSIYHANAIGNRGGLDKIMRVEINAISLGGVAWVTAPFEIFDTNAKFVRDNSPYEMTFYNGYCNGGNGYMPSIEAWEYGCYEADTASFARGTAEKLSDTFVEMLNELHG